MHLIVDMRFGSHLYGTPTPQSELDFKAVYLPAARDILLQRVRDTVTNAPDKPDGGRNAPGDVDHETLSLQRYLALLSEGQTMALDMLFAPASAMTRQPVGWGALGQPITKAPGARPMTPGPRRPTHAP